MSKTDQLRALREGKTAKTGLQKAIKAMRAPKPQKTAKARVRSNGGVLSVLPSRAKADVSSGHVVVNNQPSFDRTAYQRVYCRLNRAHGPISGWPADALAELRRYSRGKSNSLVDTR